MLSGYLVNIPSSCFIVNECDNGVVERLLVSTWDFRDFFDP